MSQPHSYTVQEVRDLFHSTIVDTFAATDDGQAHLNRIVKAITNESLVKRKASSHLTYAKTAFDKEVSKVATKTPDKLPELLERKDAWIASYIKRNYSQDEE